MKRFLSIIIAMSALLLITMSGCFSGDNGSPPEGEGGSSSENNTPPTDEYTTEGGRIFHPEDRLKISTLIEDMPNTIEATVKFPEDYSLGGGVIISNFDSSSKANTVCLSIDSTGSPVLTVRYDTSDSHSQVYTFSEANLYTGEWTHLAVVRDGSSLHCYVNGALVQTLAYTSPEITMVNRLYIGGDTRHSRGEHNYESFNGAIKNLALYSDARTGDEIASDVSLINIDDSGLVAYYDLAGTALADIIADVSSNGNAIVRDAITGGIELSETDNNSYNRYRATKVTDNYQTVEVMIRADAGEWGVIYGNNSAAQPEDSVNLEITKEGKIFYQAFDKDHTRNNPLCNTVTFTKTSVNTGEWVHITVVADEKNSEYRLYVNGTHSETVAMTNKLTVVPQRSMYLGRDYRTDSSLKQFNGEIMSLVTYADVRDPSEIRSDIMCGPEYDGELISYYDMKFADGSATVPDRTKNGADLVNAAKPLDELAVSGGGISVDTNKFKYTEQYVSSSIPKTVEFTVRIAPEKKDSQVRTVLSNYKLDNPEIYSYSLMLVDGLPRLYIFFDDEGYGLTYKFDKIENGAICTGDWVNVAITLDTDNKEIKCYVDGVLKETKSFYDDAEGNLSDTEIDAIDFGRKFIYPLCLGSTNRTNSEACPFALGELRSVVIYSDVRDAAEIAGDVYFPGTTDILSYWDASMVGVYKDIKDRTNNFNNMKAKDNTNYMIDNTTYENEGNAMTFAKDKYYEAASKLETTPLTIEAKIKYPTEGSGKGSPSKKGSSIENVIFGNFYGKTTPNALNFGINSANNPMIYAIDSLGKIHTFTFDEVTVNTEHWELIAITFDKALGYAYCYQNGVLMQKIHYNGELDGIDWSANKFAHVLGGDWQSERREYYNRKLGYLAIYSDIRSAEEIYSDAKNGISTDDEALIGYYDCAKGDKNGVISDSKDGKYDLSLFTPFFNKEEIDPDSYDYAIAVVGDTQNLTYRYNSALTTLYDWIVANAESKKIGFVVGVGDINEKDTDEEWLISSAEIAKLRDAGIPQSLVCGGVHDSIPQFNKYLPYTEYVSAYDGKVVYGFYDDGTGVYSLSNCYQLITIGETPYMFLSLEWAPKSGHVAWANEVIMAHPEYNVIITTHAYLADDATRFNTWHHATPDSTGKKEAHNGEELWDALVRKHANIVMVIGGHDCSDFVLMSEDYGDHGNRVVQLMVNPQHTDIVHKGTGMVAMLYFSDGGKTVNLEYYSTVRKAHFIEKNQFSFMMPMVEPSSKSDD